MASQTTKGPSFGRMLKAGSPFVAALAILIAFFWGRLWDPLGLSDEERVSQNQMLKPPHSLPVSFSKVLSQRSFPTAERLPPLPSHSTLLRKVWNGYGEPELFTLISRFWLLLALISFASLFVFDAPYGRLLPQNPLVLVDSRLAFALMEAPALVINVVTFVSELPRIRNSPPLFVIFAIHFLHYLNRTIVYPLRMRPGKGNSLSVIFLAMFFNTVHTPLLTRYFYRLEADRYGDQSLLWSPQFIAGFLLTIIGARINLRADGILRNLRKPGEKGYKIPRGGPFEYVTAANYAGEILEWFGFVTLTGFAPPALLFFIWTTANLCPRALRYHFWYREKFGAEYPSHRKALVPFIV